VESSAVLADEDANVKENPASRAKQLEVSQGTDNAYRLAKKYNIKTAWGTDILFSPTGGASQNRQLTKLTAVHAGRSAQDGRRGQRSIARALWPRNLIPASSVSSRKGRSPTYCLYRETRCKHQVD